MKKVEKMNPEKSETTIKKLKGLKVLELGKLKGLKVLELGFMKSIKGGCGSSDADRMCSSWCYSYSCKHDGKCGSGYFDF